MPPIDQTYQPQPATLIDPWRLWGNVANLVLDEPGGADVTISPQQLANIDYHRPETWTYLIGVSASATPGTIFVGNPEFFFDLNIGVGRANIQIKDAVRLPLDAATLTTGQTVQKYVTSFRNAFNPNFDDIDIADLPAQTIQLSGRLRIQLTGQFSIQLCAMFAPRSHVRPDWYIENFGSELGGT
jgi:hypothetical protein